MAAIRLSKAALRKLELSGPHKRQAVKRKPKRSKSQPLPEVYQAGGNGSWVSFTLPVLTKSPNGGVGISRQGMLIRAKQIKAQRRISCDLTKARLPPNWNDGTVQYRINLCRLSAGHLDGHENLQMSQKHVVDGVADALGFADDSDRALMWSYQQDTCKRGWHGVRVTILFIKRVLGVVE